jgi:hypothetical protein
VPDLHLFQAVVVLGPWVASLPLPCCPWEEEVVDWEEMKGWVVML